MIEVDKLCEVCESNKSVRNYKKSGRYLCGKHAMQMNKYGQITKRTTYDPNDFIISDEYTLMCIYNKKGEEVARAIIDNDKLEIVKKYKWYLHSNGYVCNKSKGNKLLNGTEILYLHRLIMNAPKDKFVDHINMNKLDNRVLNLRFCNNSQNMRNKEELSGNYSGFRGVRWNKDLRKWWAYLVYNKKSVNLGYYDLFADAVNARLKGEKEYYGEFAPNSNLIKNNNTITEEEFLSKAQ